MGLARSSFYAAKKIVKRNVSLTHLAQSSSVPLTSKKKYKSFTLRSCQQGTVNFVSLLFV